MSQVKFSLDRCTSGDGHYADLAHTIGESPPRNVYIKALQKKLAPPCERETETVSSNPYVELLHEHLSKLGGKTNIPPTPAQSPVTLTPKSSPPSTSCGKLRNEYVESLHARLQQMGSRGRQPVAPCPGMPSESQWWLTLRDEVTLHHFVHV